MTNPHKFALIWLHKSIPYVIATFIVFITLLLFLYFLHTPDLHLFIFLKDSLPWVILTLGITCGLVTGIVIYLVQLIKKSNISLQNMMDESQKEMIKLMKSEEIKQNLEKALLQGQKLQAIGTLAGGIAHDFNNLLYAIKGYVDMAREDIEKDTLVHRNLGKVLDATDRGRDLISRILAFSRRQHLDYKPIHIQSTLENALALLKPTIPASVNIKLEPISTDFAVTGNQTQLHQVIVNLVNNAVDAMDGEGTITFHVQQVQPYDDLSNKLSHQTGMQYCRIDITDTGCGMDQSTMERIFEPFYTTKEVGKGTGLGLSTVYSIIHNHQGLITVKSKLGHGTTFTILLPMLTIPAYDDMAK